MTMPRLPLSTLCLALWSCAVPATTQRTLPNAGPAAEGDAPPALDAIVQADISRDLHALAGDRFRGREAGTLDELRASVWLVERMREAGLDPAGDDGTYYQWVPMRRLRQADDGTIAVGATTMRLFEDAVTLAPTDLSVDAPLVYVDASSSASAADVRGKAVATALVASSTNLLPIPAGGTARPFSAAAAVRRTAARFLDMGAVAVVVVSDSAAESTFARAFDTMARGRYGVDTASATAYWPDATSGARRPAAPPIVWVRSRMLQALQQTGQRLTARLTTENFVYPTVNLVGRVRGADPRLRDEYVLYSTHQDHDGVRTAIDGDSIWNGADDNGTGSVANLAIARAFAKSPGKRSVLFVWHGAEERGLIGSRYHAMHPVVARQQIVAVLNGEMIGRNHPDSMTILGAIPPHRNSTVLVDMARQANDRVAQFELDTLWDSRTHPQGWYFRSDHLPYARLAIPAIEFSSNLHADYHTPRDDPSRIDYGKLTRVARWMYATGWLVANADQRPPVDPGFKLER
ncbi:MAG: hypothetical protein MNPFHGCM_02683 [Gemmatimonadaceae bacterium]|nr:hypothetical protein [Gemmatimonadaceae bacterium]